MNLIHDDIDDIAEAVKLRLISRGGVWAVYGRRDGKVALVRLSDNRRTHDLPDADLIGWYTKRALVADIADDLGVRRGEIAK